MYVGLLEIFAIRDVEFYKDINQSPLQAWTGPEGFRSLRLLEFKTIES
jgi:hypothetical protein